MTVSQKCQYALRAIFELAKRHGSGPMTIAQIAEAQIIPPKFLELILGELRRGGFVESRRGVQGGYMLAIEPSELTAGQIIRFVDGPFAPVKCVAGEKSSDCPLMGKCAFLSMWMRARDAVAEIYDHTSFQDLLDEELVHAGEYVANYCI